VRLAASCRNAQATPAGAKRAQLLLSFAEAIIRSVESIVQPDGLPEFFTIIWR
jgi:hypothetical protein